MPSLQDYALVQDRVLADLQSEIARRKHLPALLHSKLAEQQAIHDELLQLELTLEGLRKRHRMVVSDCSTRKDALLLQKIELEKAREAKEQACQSATLKKLELEKEKGQIRKRQEQRAEILKSNGECVQLQGKKMQHKRDTLQHEKQKFKEARQDKEKILDGIETCNETQEQFRNQLKKLQADKQRLESAIADQRSKGKLVEKGSQECLASLQKFKLKELQNYRSKRLLDQKTSQYKQLAEAGKAKLKTLLEECFTVQEYQSELDGLLSQRQRQLATMRLELQNRTEDVNTLERNIMLERDRNRQLLATREQCQVRLDEHELERRMLIRRMA